MWVKISEKNRHFFRFEISLSQANVINMGKIMLSKYGHLMLPSGTFPDKVTPGTDFTDEGVAQCDVLLVKILL